jgi:hypothetical protein
MVMELCTGGELWQFLQDVKIMPNGDKYFKSKTRGMVGSQEPWQNALQIQKSQPKTQHLVKHARRGILFVTVELTEDRACTRSWLVDSWLVDRGW